MKTKNSCQARLQHYPTMVTAKPVERYAEYTESFKLTKQQQADLVGAIQSIVENLLIKKYLLDTIDHEKT
ncbi:MAG: hypothetical protein K2Q32_01765 [Alphaproteobacteria bacterium]|nr:hypothetical protein [Alphaproteobacteria bacterium]